MKNFLLVTNEDRDLNLEFTDEIASYIKEQGGIAHVIRTGKNISRERLLNLFYDLRIAQEAVDVILVFGGDGTFVRASRDLASLTIPIIGVNLGTLGYLCELERSNVRQAIARMMKEEYEIEHRMMLEGSRSSISNKVRAFNDIVIHRKEPSQLIHLKISVNGAFLTSYHADGIIIAAPTGSTSYNLSAGGPIVDPKADMILLTPINPHDMQSRSIVIGSDSLIEVELVRRRPECDEQATVDFDGDPGVVLSVGESIQVKKSQECAKVLKLNKVSFLQILSKKMQG